MVFEFFVRKRAADQASPITEFYTLTHPFYYPEGHYNMDSYFPLWRDSITQASQREGVFAILYFCESLYDPHGIDLDTKLVKHTVKTFGKHRMLLHRSGGIGQDGIFDESVRERLVDRRGTKVIGRGVFLYQCAHGVTEAVLDAYNIPRENGSMDLVESVDTNGSVLGTYSCRQLFPNLAKRAEKLRELGEEKYQKWFEQQLEEFGNRVSFNGWWEHNFGLNRIKTYLGDQEHIERKFGELRLDGLQDEDFVDARKAHRIAIAYQFLIDPLRFYGIPKQLSTDRFHINPTCGNKPDQPRPWEADRTQVAQFHDDLAVCLLGREMVDSDIDSLVSVVNRTTEKNRVVMSVD